MAPRKRKKPAKKVKFQLSRSGIGGIAVVTFCIFLWMFLLGVWAGQSLLYPPVIKKKTDTVAKDSGEGKKILDVIQLEAEKKKKIISH